MESILRFFIERHLLVNIIAGSLVVLGYLSATGLNREFIPAIKSPLIFITANLPGQAPGTWKRRSPSPSRRR